MRKSIALLLVTVFLAGCSFSQKEDIRYDKATDGSSSVYPELKELVRSESPAKISTYLDGTQIDLSMEQANELFDIVVNRGSADVYTLLAKRQIFKLVMGSGEFVFRQRAMNLDIRGSLISQLSASLEDLESVKLKDCSEILSAAFFLRWAQARLVENSISIASVLSNKKCGNIDAKLLSYLYRNELAFLYLNSSSSLNMLVELTKLHEISRKSYLAGSFTWGQLMISPLLVLRSLPEGAANREQLASIYNKMKIELEASSDIAYYVVARSGSYRVGRFSNTVELVSLEETLISELVQQNADFIFDRTIPVDQDIRLP